MPRWSFPSIMNTEVPQPVTLATPVADSIAIGNGVGAIHWIDQPTSIRRGPPTITPLEGTGMFQYYESPTMAYVIDLKLEVLIEHLRGFNPHSYALKGYSKNIFHIMGVHGIPDGEVYEFHHKKMYDAFMRWLDGKDCKHEELDLSKGVYKQFMYCKKCKQVLWGIL